METSGEGRPEEPDAGPQGSPHSQVPVRGSPSPRALEPGPSHGGPRAAPPRCALAQVPADDGRALLLRSRLLYPETHVPAAADRGACIQRVLHPAAPEPCARSAQPSVLVSPFCSVCVPCKRPEGSLLPRGLKAKIQAPCIHFRSAHQPHCCVCADKAAAFVGLYLCHLAFSPKSWRTFYVYMCGSYMHPVGCFPLKTISCLSFCVQTRVSLPFLMHWD